MIIIKKQNLKNIRNRKIQLSLLNYFFFNANALKSDYNATSNN